MAVDSNGNVFDERAIFGNPVGPGEGNRVSSGFHIMLDASAPTGTWTATVTADPNNQVSESNEYNNVHTLTFEVVAPNSDTTPPTVTLEDEIILGNGITIIATDPDGRVHRLKVPSDGTLKFNAKVVEGNKLQVDQPLPRSANVLPR